MLLVLLSAVAVTFSALLSVFMVSFVFLLFLSLPLVVPVPGVPTVSALLAVFMLSFVLTLFLTLPLVVPVPGVPTVSALLAVFMLLLVLAVFFTLALSLWSFTLTFAFPLSSLVATP